MASLNSATLAPHRSLPITTPDPHGVYEQPKGKAEANSISPSQSQHGMDVIRIADSSIDPHTYDFTSSSEGLPQPQSLPPGCALKDVHPILGGTTGPDSFVGILSTSDSGHIGVPDVLGLGLIIHRPGGVHTPPLSSHPSVLSGSLVSPPRGKSGRFSGGFSSESSASGSTESFPELGDDPDHRVCAARCLTDCGLNRHSMPADGTVPGTTGPKMEPDGTVTAAAGPGESTITKTGDSPRSDSTSDRSNSDIEIYLDTHGLDNSATRMNRIRNNSTLSDAPSQGARGSPVSSLPVQPKPTQAVSQARIVSAQNEGSKSVVDGWVTSQRTAAQGRREQISSMEPLPKPGEPAKPRAKIEENGGDNGAAKISSNNEGSHGQGAGSSHGNKQPGDKTDDKQVLQSVLRPASADFKPRIAIELKPPLAEFKPARMELIPPQVAFTTKPPSSNRGLTSTLRASLVQSDTSHTHPSNRTSSSQNFQDQVSEQHDDHVSRNALRTHMSCSEVGQEPISTNGDHILLELSQVSEGPERSPFDDSHKTPNVYINGLPPHFPEDQLYALAAPFGEVKSVRTFTRHVRDSESGYGFETIEAAERCILSLRRYRNLHPTFSKQIHKIPGTVYAQNLAQSIPEPAASVDSWDSKRDESDSFKRRMESLADPTSTNLYMEGLPLSIDEPTLVALVSPHRISSSRFFQTRLSNPPRIIAFVRLETRRGAEEIIERLHGRMVRGWNDAGSRISVRFADTAEQRELRRTERVAKEGDSTAPKLTIAQAALLNLRGQELRQAANVYSLPVIGEHKRQNPVGYSFDEFSSGGLHIRNPQVPQPVIEVDYSLVPRLGGTLPAQRITSPSGALQPSYGRQNPRNANASTPIQLDGLRGNTIPFASTVSRDDYIHQHNAPLQDQPYVGSDYGIRPPPAQAKSGYTPTEELIMRAHTEARHRPTPVCLPAQTRGPQYDAEVPPADVATGFRGYRTRAAAAVSLDRRGSSVLPGMQPASTMEGEFHFMGTGTQTQMQCGADQDPDATVRAASREYTSHTSQSIRMAPAPHDTFHAPVLPTQPHSFTSSVGDHHHHQHLRSTTFPHQPPPTQHQRHQQHSSLGNPATSQRTPQHASTAVMGQSNLVHEKHDYQNSLVEQKAIRREASNNTPYSSKLQHHPSNSNLAYDMDNQPSPSLISPTLTYSSQTPSTLSPATPFFGSFSSQNESFERGFDGKKFRSAAH